MRKSAIYCVAAALLVAGCGESGSDDEIQSDVTEEDEWLEPEEVGKRIAMAQSCALAHDKLGKFYLTLAEVEKDPTEANKYREMAKEKLPIIEAFNEYAEGMKADYEVSDTDFEASKNEVTQRVDSEFASREMEDFLNLMADAADRCSEQIDSGGFG